MFEVGKKYVNTQSNKTAKCVYIDTHHQIAVLSGSGGLYTPPTNSPYWKEARSIKYWTVIVDFGFEELRAIQFSTEPSFQVGYHWTSESRVIAIQEHEWIEKNV